MNIGAPWPTPSEAEARVLWTQTKLHRWAGDDSSRRFDDLFNLVCDPATLMVAWSRVRGNTGARTAGVDGHTVRSIEAKRCPCGGTTTGGRASQHPGARRTVDRSLTTARACGEPDAGRPARPVRRAGRGNGPSETTAPRPAPDPTDWPREVPLPKTHVSAASSGRKEPLWADVVSGRRFAIAEMDGFHRNRWTIWIGLSGRVQSEWVDALDRNGWTISGGIINPRR